MTPSEAGQSAINELEELSNAPVVLREDARLANLAKIQLEAGGQPVHVLSYNPTVLSELPYLVCFQCGIATRAILAARAERFDVASNEHTYKQVENLVRKQRAIPDHMIPIYSQMITDGLGTQLRSMPIGIRVDRSLYRQGWRALWVK